MATIRGTIDRRILLNVRIDPSLVAERLPAPFSPRIVDGWALAGICLIRMAGTRPGPVSPGIGLRSENAAHRVSVQWRDRSGQIATGVYVPRRDTSSRLAARLGGLVFASRQALASFAVEEADGTYDIAVTSADGLADLEVRASVGSGSWAWSRNSVFADLAQASDFYRCDSLGFSPGGNGGHHGVELATERWAVRPLQVHHYRSTWFDSYPDGSVELDNALVMTGIDCRWRLNPEQARIPR